MSTKPLSRNDTDEASLPHRLLARHRFAITSVVVIAIFAVIAYALYRLTEEVRYEDVAAALAETPPMDIALAIFLTGLSFAALILYDMNALDHIGRRLPMGAVAMTSFIAYAVGNTVGFGALSGGTIRFRAYSRLGLQPGEIARVIAFVTLSFGLGLASVSALATLAVAPRIAGIMGIGPNVLNLFAVGIIIVVALLFFLARNGRTFTMFGVTLQMPDSRTASRQFLVSALDIAAAATVLYVLIPETHVGWPTFLAIYATAIGIGMLSHVPAGLGVFEAVMMAGLANAVSLDQLLGSLILYRLVYYVLPLLLAVVLLLATETRQIASRPEFQAATQVTAKLAPLLISSLTLMLGTMLIFSSVVPTGPDNLDYLERILPLPIVEGAHFMSSMLGLLLVISARGVARRLDGAWWVAIAAATAALVLAFLKAVAVYEAALLALLVASLLFNRSVFDRPASLVGQALGPSWLAAMAVIVLALPS